MTEPESTPEPTATWTAAAVARRLGVAPATLRSWGARYGIGPPTHEAGRYRRYSTLDIAELETVRRLHLDGMPMAAAVEVARTRHRLPTPSGPARTAGTERRDTAPVSGSGGRGTPVVALAALLDAIHELDSAGAVRILQDALSRHGVADTWYHLCRPALTSPVLTAGTPDAPGEPHDPRCAGLDPVACVDVECVLVWAITTSLRRLAPAAPAAPGTGSVLLACAVGELHTLGLDVLLAALDERGIPARTLGASVPTAALVRAAERIRPAVVFVWAQTPDTADPTVLGDLRTVTTTVVAAGPGWSALELPPGVGAVDDLDHALAHAGRTRNGG